MEFYFPTEFGEQLAFGAAALSVVIGLVFMFAPGITLRVFGLEPTGGRQDGYVLIRSSLAGFYLGLGAAALLLAQPMVYLAFGAAFALAVFGVILSILSDGGATLRNFILLVVHLLLSALSLSYVFGLV
ncbi:phage infection protein [Agrobacterium tumefaciens]|uniref:AGROH133_08824 family phage infection protein n=1 Tax=Agrobacterium tumefaciens TaxID=358 RepID=UPI00287C0E87|nr:phage infection protein [Agrobacterium tumefaciens]MDS7598051.1 phage infection protein [Agrobacterium tumefaciens]